MSGDAPFATPSYLIGPRAWYCRLITSVIRFSLFVTFTPLLPGPPPQHEKNKSFKLKQEESNIMLTLFTWNIIALVTAVTLDNIISADVSKTAKVLPKILFNVSSSK